LSYFVNGGKVASVYILKLYKGSKGELKARSFFHRIATKDAPDFEDLAHRLWESSGSGGKGITEDDIRKEIEDVVFDKYRC
jgi:hypothetical protein